MSFLALTAFLCLRDVGHLVQGRIAAALSLSILGMLALELSAPYSLPPALAAIAWFAYVPNIVLLWWFGLSLFQDDFELRLIHWTILALVYAIVFVMMISETYAVSAGVYGALITNRLIGLCLLAHLFWIAFHGRDDDLIEVRRRTRIGFIIGAALVALSVILGELFLYLYQNASQLPAWFTTLRLVLILPMVLYVCLWLLRLSTEAFNVDASNPVSPSVGQIDPRDRATHMRLIHAMETDRYYRELGLSIGDLADRIDVPEHQLRVLINRGLGYRNFASFLNHYRLLDAKQTLADPELAREPILSVAMNVGYASLSTFNRVFKAEAGVTPSEYRAHALETPAAAPLKAPLDP